MPNSRRQLAFIATLLGFAVLSLDRGLHAQTTSPLGQRPDGKPVMSLTQPNVATKAVVLFFVASDCPISDRTFPEMQRVRELYERRGFAFWFVYPNFGERGADVQRHQQAFDPNGQAILDTSGGLARLAHARMTPEVAVLVPSRSHSWNAVYTGRIDDRYVRLGLERPSATQHFAERVLAEVLSNKPVEAPTGNPVGCGIVSPPR
jgi:hypothetical protein